jgi:hypothetical protein
MHSKTVSALVLCLALPVLSRAQTNTDNITAHSIEAAEEILDLDFSESQIQMLVPSLKEQLRGLIDCAAENSAFE